MKVRVGIDVACRSPHHAAIADEATVGKIKRNIHEDMQSSTELNLNEWLRRPAIHKLGENLCALMTPVL